MKLDTFAYSATGGWSVTPLPDLDSEDTLVVAFGAPELDDVQAPLAQLTATYKKSHVIGCSTAGEIFGVGHDRLLRVFDAGGPTMPTSIVRSSGR